MSALALKAYGTSIADDLASDKEAYNGEKMVAIYQKMKDMIDAGYWGDGILSTDFNTERNMFEAGKAAFTVAVTSRMTPIQLSSMLRRSVLQEFLISTKQTRL